VGSLLARALTDQGNPKSLVRRLRAKRLGPLLAMVETVFREQGAVRIIDVGGTEAYWDVLPRGFLEKHNVAVTIVNLPGSLSPREHRLFSFVAADGCELSLFEDKSFDVGFSHSVVEHVGDWSRMVRFANELQRVARRLIVQTPSFWFPVEPHFMTPFFHWLPRPLRVHLVLHFSLGHFTRASTVDEAVRIVENARMLDRAMFQALFKEATILTERVLGFPKSFIAVMNR
jgi:hypothetical protein